MTVQPNIRGHVFALIEYERDRQEDLRDKGKFPETCATPGVSNATCLAVLIEEVGEVATELLPNGSVDDLATELVQVAAICVAWLERLEAAS